MKKLLTILLAFSMCANTSVVYASDFVDFSEEFVMESEEAEAEIMETADVLEMMEEYPLEEEIVEENEFAESSFSVDDFLSLEDEDFLDVQQGTYILSHEGIYQEGAFHEKSTNVVLNAALEDEITSKIMNCVWEMDLSAYQISVTEIDDLVMLYMNRHPEFYYVTFNTCDMEDGNVSVLKATVKNPSGQNGISIAALDGRVQTEVDKAIAILETGMTDVEKALAIHDYLIDIIAYDTAGLEANQVPEADFTVYGALVNRSCVCQGYALAYELIMNRLGIECIVVGSDPMNHAWNMVKIGNNWYHVDNTWDDPVEDKLGRVTHEYFLLSDTGISDHSGWASESGTVTPSANSTLYDSASVFWKAISGHMYYQSGYWYYAQKISGGTNICKRTIANHTSNTATVVSKITATWPVVDEPGYSWGSQCKMVLFDGKIYYTYPTKVYSMNLDGTNVTLVKEISPVNSYIYGLSNIDGVFYYVLHQSPNDSDRETHHVLDISNNLKQYTITYVEDPATGKKFTHTQPEGTKVTILNTSISIFGKRVLGWSESQTGTGTLYKTDSTMVLNRNMTLYPVWGDVEEIKEPCPITKQIRVESGEKILYKFVPTLTGKYTFESSGDLDTYFVLFDENEQRIVSNDDDGENNNFKCIQALVAGTTYYVQMYLWDATKSGDFELKVTTNADKQVIVIFDANGGTNAPAQQEGLETIQLNTSLPIKAGYDFVGWAETANATAAQYQPGDTFNTVGITTLYAVWKTNYITFSNPKVPEDAIAIANLKAGEKRYIRMEAKYSGTYAFWSEGTNDTFGILYDAVGNVLKQDDDGGSGSNFRIEYDLKQGSVYFLLVRFYSSSRTGELEAHMNMLNPFGIATQPRNVEVEGIGDTATVTVEGVGDGLTYQWYYKDPSSSSYIAGGTAKSFAFSVSNTQNGRLLYCVLRDSYGNVATTDTVKVTAKPTFTIAYHLDDKAAAGGTSRVVYGTSTVTKKAKELGFSKSGKVFAGWKVYRADTGCWRVADSKGVQSWAKSVPSGGSYYLYADGVTVGKTVPAGETVHFYGQWNDTEFTIAYHVDDTTAASATSKVVYGTSTAVRTIANLGFKKSGKEFAGWKIYREDIASWRVVDSKGIQSWSKTVPSGGKYYLYVDGVSVGKTTPAGTTVHFYAQWNDTQFTIAYHSDDTASASATSKVVYGTSTAVRTINNLGFSKSGKEFAGWKVYRDDIASWRVVDSKGVQSWSKTVPSGGKYYLYTDGVSVAKTTPAGTTVHFYAQWKTANVFTIAYHLDDTAPVGNTSQVVYGTSTAIKTVSSLGFSKSGKEFAGWKIYREDIASWRVVDSKGVQNWSKTVPSGGDYYLYADATSVGKTTPAGTTVHFYAQWKLANAFTIAYHLDDTAPVGGTSQVVYGTSTAIKTISALGFSKSGKSFAGWKIYREDIASWRVVDSKGVQSWSKTVPNGGKYYLYTDGVSVGKTTPANTTVHFYAQWK